MKKIKKEIGKTQFSENMMLQDQLCNVGKKHIILCMTN